MSDHEEEEEGNTIHHLGEGILLQDQVKERCLLFGWKEDEFYSVWFDTMELLQVKSKISKRNQDAIKMTKEMMHVWREAVSFPEAYTDYCMTIFGEFVPFPPFLPVPFEDQNTHFFLVQFEGMRFAFNDGTSTNKIIKMISTETKCKVELVAEMPGDGVHMAKRVT